MTYKVSKSFLRDFAFVANYYEWNDSDIEEIKQCVRENKGMKEYIEKLAFAHRNGYKQCRENNYIRLHQWLYERG